MLVAQGAEVRQLDVECTIREPKEDRLTVRVRHQQGPRLPVQDVRKDVELEVATLVVEVPVAKKCACLDVEGAGARMDDPFIAAIPDDRELAVGDVLDSKYVIEGLIGRGGMGTAYRALVANNFSATRCFILLLLDRRWVERRRRRRFVR